MKWPAFFAAILLPRSVMKSRASEATAATSAASGHARTTGPRPKTDGPSASTSDWIARRAMRVCNRDRKAALIYERVQNILARGLM
jgi:hypothetical protein